MDVPEETIDYINRLNCMAIALANKQTVEALCARVPSACETNLTSMIMSTSRIRSYSYEKIHASYTSGLLCRPFVPIS